MKLIIVIFVLFSFIFATHSQPPQSASNSAISDDSSNDQESSLDNPTVTTSDVQTDISDESSDVPTDNNSDEKDVFISSSDNSDDHQVTKSSSSKSFSPSVDTVVNDSAFNDQDRSNEKTTSDNNDNNSPPTIDIDKLIEKKSPEEVVITLKKLAKKGSDEAKLKLAITYFYGNPLLDLDTSFEYFQELSAKGNSLAHLV